MVVTLSVTPWYVMLLPFFAVYDGGCDPVVGRAGRIQCQRRGNAAKLSKLNPIKGMKRHLLGEGPDGAGQIAGKFVLVGCPLTVLPLYVCRSDWRSMLDAGFESDGPGSGDCTQGLGMRIAIVGWSASSSRRR